MTEVATPVEQPTQELVQSLFDYKDGVLYWRRATSNRNHKMVGKMAGWVGDQGYAKININGKAYSAHRLIFMFHHGYMPNQVDHVDGDRGNNRIENLRAATHEQNAQNAKLRCNNTSGIKGVSFNARRKKWIVQLRCNRRHVYVGGFDDIELAELAAVEVRDLYHKEYANHGKHPY